MNKEIAILFSTPMVRAILAGNKTMTRRIMKQQPKIDEQTGDVYLPSFNEVVPVEEWKKTQIGLCKYQIGDLLWVRETFQYFDVEYSGKIIPVYKVDYKNNEWKEWTMGEESSEHFKWKPSIFMPKEACRIWLEVTDLKVERLDDITEEDAKMEGLDTIIASPKLTFIVLWDHINGDGAWNENPFVWVISFKVLSTTGKP